MQSLTNAQGLTNDDLVKGVMQEIITVSDFLAYLPFDDIVGDGIRYNRESALPTVSWRSRTGTWTEDAAVRVSVTAQLYILGGDTDVSEFDRKVYGNVQDQESLAIAEKAKAMARTFETDAVYGNNATNVLQPSGLHALITGTQSVNNCGVDSTTERGLQMALLDEMIDTVLPARPDYLMLNRTVLRRLNAFYRGAGSPQPKGEDAKPLSDYGGVPILVNDHILMTETVISNDFGASTGGTGSSVFAFRFGSTGLHGIQNGDGIETIELGMLHDRDAQRHRLRWYAGIALKSTLSCASLVGVSDAAAA
jgi:hypothetical protein